MRGVVPKKGWAAHPFFDLITVDEEGHLIRHGLRRATFPSRGRLLGQSRTPVPTSKAGGQKKREEQAPPLRVGCRGASARGVGQSPASTVGVRGQRPHVYLTNGFGQGYGETLLQKGFPAVVLLYLTCPAGRQCRGAPGPRGTQGMRRRRWRCGSCAWQGRTVQLRKRSRRRQQRWYPCTRP